jgi:hypothetical protein
MKKSYCFLLLFIFPLLISCQNDEELTEIENSQNELIGILKSEIGDLKDNNIYLLPTGLSNEEILFRLMMWTDLGSEAKNKLLVLGKIENEALLEIMDAINYENGSIYHSENKYDLIQSAEKIQLKDGTIASRQSFEGFEIE